MKLRIDGAAFEIERAGSAIFCFDSEQFTAALRSELHGALEDATFFSKSAAGSLQGRSSVRVLCADGGGQFVARPYRRGGMLRALTRCWYFSAPNAAVTNFRPIAEFCALAFLRASSVSVVRPVCAAVLRHPSRLLYKGVLLTEQVAESMTLAEHGRASHGALPALAERAGQEASRMLRTGILHVDLHPGNVLVTEDAQPVLLDFDRARYVHGRVAKERGRRYLLKRWARAVTKWQLPESLISSFSNGIFSEGILRAQAK